MLCKRGRIVELSFTDEQVVKAAIVKQTFGYSYNNLAFHLVARVGGSTWPLLNRNVTKYN